MEANKVVMEGKFRYNIFVEILILSAKETKRFDG